MSRKVRTWLVFGICVVVLAGCWYVWFENRPFVRRTRALIGVFESWHERFVAGDVEGMRALMILGPDGGGKEYAGGGQPQLFIEDGGVIRVIAREGYDYTDGLRTSKARFRPSCVGMQHTRGGNGKIYLTNGFVVFKDGKISEIKLML